MNEIISGNLARAESALEKVYKRYDPENDTICGEPEVTSTDHNLAMAVSNLLYAVQAIQNHETRLDSLEQSLKPKPTTNETVEEGTLEYFTARVAELMLENKELKARIAKAIQQLNDEMGEWACVDEVYCPESVNALKDIESTLEGTNQ